MTFLKLNIKGQSYYCTLTGNHT